MSNLACKHMQLARSCELCELESELAESNRIIADQNIKIERLKAEIAALKRPDFSGMREMLRTMQAGELTVSRGIELLEMWSAGNYSDDMLPPVRQGLIEEDSMPVEIIERLKAERDHWKANHDNQVERARILIERPDLPVERVEAYKQWTMLKQDYDLVWNELEQRRAMVKELREENDSLKTQLNATYGCEDCPGIPKLTSRRVADAAFKAVFWDRPEFFEGQPAQSEPLENIRLFAARHRKEEWAKTILRFCTDAGCTGNPLRDTQQPAQREPKSLRDMTEADFDEAHG